jgi:putative ABC transport system permease protein
MMRIAVKMLFHSRARSLSTLIGVAIAFLLSSAQVGLLVGWCNTIAAIMRHSNVDVWVMAAQNPAFDYGTPIPEERLYQVLCVPGVDWAESMIMSWLFWRCPDGRMINVELVGVDDSLAGAPWRMAENDVSVVLEPDAVIVDELYAKQLGVSQIGDEIELTDRKAVVRGFSQGVRTATASPFVFASVQSALRYDPRYRDDEITYVLARCAPGTSPDQLRDAIAASVPAVDVMTTSGFIRTTISYWLFETGLGLTIIVTAILGLVVGTVIISQALFAITNDHLHNYATLMAIGFKRWQLIATVLIQATLLAMVGIAIGSALFGRAADISQATPVPIEITLPIFAAIVAAFLVCCLAASFLSIRTIFHIDPVSVFRN